MDQGSRPDFSFIVDDNERAVADALERADFLQAYLLLHALVEALLRMFLHVPESERVSFNELIEKYGAYLRENRYPIPTFSNELTEFNRRRNRMAHQLWRRGVSFTNRQAQPAARAAL